MAESEEVGRPVLWVCGVLGVSVAFVVGLRVIVDDDRWWAQLIGGLVSAASAALAVVVVKRLRPPLRTYDEIDPVAPDTVANWDAAMKSSGRVEVGLSPLRVFKTVGLIVVAMFIFGLLISGVLGVVAMCIGVLALISFTFLGVIPQLQFMTGGRPAVLVDSSGIEIARWGRLAIPWDDIHGVEVLQSARRQVNAVVLVSPSFYRQDLAARPVLCRLAELPARVFARNAYAIPTTTSANSRTLGTWLAQEATLRRGQQ